MFPAFPLALLWAVLMLATVLPARRMGLPGVTGALTLTAAVMALLAISAGPLFAPFTAGPSLPGMGAAPAAQSLHAARSQYLTGLAMAVFGAGGVVLLAGGLIRGAMAGTMQNLGAIGLLLLHLSALVLMVTAYLPGPNSPMRAQTPPHFLYWADLALGVTTVAVPLAALLILALLVLAPVSRLFGR